MQTSGVFQNLDTLAVFIPSFLILAIGVFRLDSVFAAHDPKNAPGRWNSIGGTDENGEQILTDPDGRSW